METKISEIKDDIISFKYKGKLVTINISRELEIN